MYPHEIETCMSRIHRLLALVSVAALLWGCSMESYEECYVRVYDNTGSTFQAEDACSGKVREF